MAYVRVCNTSTITTTIITTTHHPRTCTAWLRSTPTTRRMHRAMSSREYHCRSPWRPAITCAGVYAWA